MVFVLQVVPLFEHFPCTIHYRKLVVNLVPQIYNLENYTDLPTAGYLPHSSPHLLLVLPHLPCSIKDFVLVPAENLASSLEHTQTDSATLIMYNERGMVGARDLRHVGGKDVFSASAESYRNQRPV